MTTIRFSKSPMASVPALARREANRLSGCGRNRTCTAEASDLQSDEPTTLLNAPVMPQSERRESNPFLSHGKAARNHYATLAYRASVENRTRARCLRSSCTTFVLQRHFAGRQGIEPCCSALEAKLIPDRSPSRCFVHVLLVDQKRRGPTTSRWPAL